MPRLKNRTPRMTRNRNTAIVCIDGQTIRLGRWGSDEADEAYRRTIAEWMANNRKLPAPTTEDEPVPVAEVLAMFWKHAQGRYSAAKVSAIRQAIRVPRELYGSEPAEAFGPKRLAVCRDQMLAKGWSRGYVNEACGWIRRAFRYGAAHELIPSSVHNRLDALEPLKRGEGGRETEKVKPVPREHIRKIRRHLSRPVRALITLQLLTGARADELVRIKPTDFDRSGPVWTVTYDGSGESGSHKTAHHDKERVLYFGPRAQWIINLFTVPGRSLDKPLFSPREANAELKGRDAKHGRRANQKPNPVRPVHRWKNPHGEGKVDEPRRIGDAYTTATYRRAIHRACDKTFVPPASLKGKTQREAWRKAHRWGPHRLRHNSGTQLRRQFGLDVASVILGHSSLAITQTYAELNDKKAREAVAQVG